LLIFFLDDADEIKNIKYLDNFQKETLFIFKDFVQKFSNAGRIKGGIECEFYMQTKLINGIRKLKKTIKKIIKYKQKK